MAGNGGIVAKAQVVTKPVEVAHKVLERGLWRYGLFQGLDLSLFRRFFVLRVLNLGWKPRVLATTG
jgi:hypothetical protein